MSESGEVGDDHPLPELFTKAQWATLGDHFGLSARQRQTARLICLGFSNVGIARNLGLGPNTVRMHNRELFRKLGVGQRMGVAVRLMLTDRELSRGR